MKSTTIKIVALLLTACVFLGVTSCSLFGGGAEEETTEPTTIASATPLMKEPAEILSYFNLLMAKIKAGKAAVKYSSSFDPNGFECDNETFKATLPTIVKLMKKGFNDGRGAEVAYGDPLTDIFPTKGQDMPFTLLMNSVAKNEDGTYQIAVNADAFSRYYESSSKAEAEQANLPEGETVTTEYVELDEDVRRITITLVDEEDPQAGAGLMGTLFDIPDRAKIAEEMKAIEGYVKYDGTYKAKYTGCSIYMEINRTTDEVVKVEFNRNIEVEVNVTGVGTLASLGETTLKFVVNGSDCYEFDWADPNATTAVAE